MMRLIARNSSDVRSKFAVAGLALGLMVGCVLDDPGEAEGEAGIYVIGSAPAISARAAATPRVREERPMPTPEPQLREARGVVELSQRSIVTAKPVPGKSGHVYSPYHPTGLVDVREMVTGTLAKDPYTGKLFIVP